MEKYLVVRPNDSVEVLILHNVSDGKYSFVNLTNGHICKCKFNSIDDALKDMDDYIKNGKVIRYEKIK